MNGINEPCRCQCVFAIKNWTVETAIDNFRYFYSFVIQYSVTSHDWSANNIHSICSDTNEQSECHLQPLFYAERAQRHFPSYKIATKVPNYSVTEIGRTILPLHGNIHEICLIDSRIFNRIYYDLIVIVVYKHKVLAENVELNDWAVRTIRIGIVYKLKTNATHNRIVFIGLNRTKYFQPNYQIEIEYQQNLSSHSSFLYSSPISVLCLSSLMIVANEK